MTATCTDAIRSLRATQALHCEAARRAKQTRRDYSRAWHVCAALEIRRDIRALAATAR